LNCDLDGRDRSFLEFPSIAVDSKGAAVITYNDNFNQAQASYVMVARQTRGPSLYQSVGFLKPQPGSVNITAPTSGTTIATPVFAARGTHTLPPKNFDNDESGDARFPDHGPVIGTNIPAFDIQSVTMENDGQNLTVTMHVSDLRPTALATAAAQGGGDGVLYLTQWHVEESIVWVAAEVRATAPVFYTGTISTINSATSKKFITYNPDLAKSTRVTGSIEAGVPGKIILQIPLDLVGGSALVSATGYAFSERGPLVPAGAGMVPDPTSLPLKIDASGAFSYTIGEGRKSDGTVEISVNDAKFKKPRIATLGNQNQWEISFPTSELRFGSHTLYVRQRIDGTSASPAASVNFTIPKTLP
ncbi:MAG TPA: hypothetical protein VJ521_07610, partial [Acidobacteriota bacterium]|nr:hypothetical protein [Acidobacteriota bacterium]